jgi:hypothetical protein
MAVLLYTTECRRFSATQFWKGGDFGPGDTQAASGSRLERNPQRSARPCHVASRALPMESGRETGPCRRVYSRGCGARGDREGLGWRPQVESGKGSTIAVAPGPIPQHHGCLGQLCISPARGEPFRGGRICQRSITRSAGDYAGRGSKETKPTEAGSTVPGSGWGARAERSASRHYERLSTLATPHCSRAWHFGPGSRQSPETPSAVCLEAGKTGYTPVSITLA